MTVLDHCDIYEEALSRVGLNQAEAANLLSDALWALENVRSANLGSSQRRHYDKAWRALVALQYELSH